MPYVFRILLLYSLSWFTVTFVSAQENRKITGDFKQMKFEQFVRTIEEKTNCHFYFNREELDTVTLSVKASEASLRELLNMAFQGTSFNFSIDSSNNVFVSRKVLIQTSLPTGFFDRRRSADTSSSAIPVFADEADEKEKFKSSIENKLFEIGNKSNNPGQGKAILTGYVRDIKNGEALIGASVSLDNSSVAVVTDQFGYFSVTLPRGRHVLLINSMGMKETKRQIMLYSDGKLNIELEDYVANLKTVIVVAEKKSNVKSTQMGVERLNIKTIKQVPAIFGETDILRVVLALPGVVSVGEASTGFNVRGGSADQNLILFNDATIYNPSHLFGFFSAFNADVVKSVELYKSAIPAKYGGRLSSVLDVASRDGNSKKISGSGGIGPLTSKLTIEGPLIKDKTTFILGGRTTYSNWLLNNLPNSEYSNSRASFYDVDLHISHTINAKNNLYFTGYISNDKFNLNSDTVYKYGNKNINLKWKHNFNNKFYSVVTGGYDRYQYSVSSEQNPVNAFKLSFDINQANFRADFNYSPNNTHSIDFGVNAIHYKLHPGSFQPLGSQSLVVPDELQSEQALETAVYLGDRFAITDKLSLNAGIRYSFFNYLGAHDVYSYAAGVPKNKLTLQDTTSYASGDVISTYHGPEYRVALRYSLTDNASVKASYNTLRQYIHMLSNTTAISPTDIWKLSDPNIKPQQGYQVSLGFYKNFKSNTIETSVEVYYKQMKNFLDYKSGASLLMNHHIETEVISTVGKAYGAEFMIKKTSGKLNGWISYTYSRTFLKVDDPTAGETINNDEYYPANFDKPNNVNFIGNYRFSHRFSVSLNMVYSTGRPITLPIAVFNTAGAQRVYYSDRNEYRIPDYFRTDLSFNIEGNHKIKKLTHNSWSFGVYNLTARKNAYSVYFKQEGGVLKGYQLSIFGTAIPFITYNFRF